MPSWTCPTCGAHFDKDRASALGMARSNHMRKHQKPIHPVWIPRNYEQYPEEICGEMNGDCINCPVPANMRFDCHGRDMYL